MRACGMMDSRSARDHNQEHEQDHDGRAGLLAGALRWLLLEIEYIRPTENHGTFT
ncbi:MAG: hypothetical protein QOH24_162 [Verrucomicrobiota bacterium]|jgi:hypothetical protein